jgi:RNA polymerase sigma-70 factor (ECF subfamily)
MWAVALRTLRDPEEASDALQEAFISAFRAAGSFRAESQVTTWLHRIVVNACLDRARRKSIRKTVPLPDQQEDEEKGGRDVAVAEDPTDDADLSMDIAAALDTLPPDQRAALVLVDLQGYPVDEAGKILGVPTGTVKSRCARGRARLVPLLAHLRQGGDPPVGPSGGQSVREGNQKAPDGVEADVKGKVVPLHRGAAKSTGGPPGQSGPAEGADRRT